MAAKSYYWANIVENLGVRAIPYTPATTVYAALFAAAPTAAYTAAAPNGTELAGNGYARLPITFGPPVNGATSNTNELDFGPATGAGWPPIVDIAVMDALVGGNLLYFGTQSPNQSVATGNTFRIPVGSLPLSET